MSFWGNPQTQWEETEVTWQFKSVSFYSEELWRSGKGHKDEWKEFEGFLVCLFFVFDLEGRLTWKKLQSHKRWPQDERKISDVVQRTGETIGGRWVEGAWHLGRCYPAGEGIWGRRNRCAGKPRVPGVHHDSKVAWALSSNCVANTCRYHGQDAPKDEDKDKPSNLGCSKCDFAVIVNTAPPISWLLTGEWVPHLYCLCLCSWVSSFLEPNVPCLRPPHALLQGTASWALADCWSLDVDFSQFTKFSPWHLSQHKEELILYAQCGHSGWPHGLVGAMEN